MFQFASNLAANAYTSKLDSASPESEPRRILANRITSARFRRPDRFCRVIEAQLGRKIGPKKIGPPKKPQTSAKVASNSARRTELTSASWNHAKTRRFINMPPAQR